MTVLQDCSFRSIEGHERPLSILKRAVKHDALAHAYLFSGEEGIGKKMTAFALAAAINCAAAGPDGGCGVCPSCRKIIAGTHPDVRVLVPDGNEIKIDQIREVQSDLALKPFEGTKKALFVDGADCMNQAAANAFLKTLEEPPGDALIVLLTALPQRLLPTIRSRCQEIRFYPLARHTLAQALEKKRGVSSEDAWFLAALAQGSMGRALAMEIDHEKSERREIFEMLSGVDCMGPEEALGLSETFSKDRERFERMISIAIERLRDTMVSSLTQDAALLVNTHSDGLPSDGVKVPALQRILADLDLLVRSRGLLERRVSTQLVAENLFLKLGRK